MTKTDDQIDALILAAAPAEWVKVALLISKVFDAPGFDKKTADAQAVAERIYILADHGRLAVQGNMRRWRDGEVKRLGV